MSTPAFGERPLPVTHHRTAMIDGVNTFYREAGAPEAPVLLLLHGFPTSSHMFRNLIPALADRYHLIAPDYPGYGQSDMSDRAGFAYTFDRFAELVDGLLGRLEVERFAMYVMDYGAPAGWRLALKHPERISALIVQNGNATRKGSRSSGARCNAEIQLDLFYDYRTNLPLYPMVQAYFRERQPPTLIVWGKNDKIFPGDGAHPYKRDLQNVEFHLFETGHWRIRWTRWCR